MALTLLEMRTRVANRVGTSSDNDVLLNKGQEKLAQMSKRRARATLAFTSGEATIPATCLILKKLAFDGYPCNLAPESEFVFPKYESNVTPEEFQISNGKIVLETKFTGSGTIVYVPKPATMSLDGATPEFASCEEAIIAYAIHKRYADNEDVIQAEYWKNQWLSEAEDWLDLDKKQNRQSFRVKAGSWS